MIKINENESLNLQNEQFIDNEDLQAYFYPDVEVFHFIWQRKCIGQKYRENFLKAVEFSSKTKGKYFLSDLRKQGVVGPEDRKWFQEEVIPEAINNGLQKAALVFEGNVFKMYYVNLLLAHFLKMEIPMKMFKDTNTALEWLVR
jgi:hypothetical protein